MPALVRPGTMADIVIGQADFMRSVVNYPNNDPTRPNSQSLNDPVGLVLDSQGNLFVADAGNGRVLRFPQPFNQSVTAFEAADLVLGQSSFTAQITDPTPRTMRLPYGLAVTSDGGLLVSDIGLNRVLLFDGPESGFVNGMTATKVFGQPDFKFPHTRNGYQPDGCARDTLQPIPTTAFTSRTKRITAF